MTTVPNIQPPPTYALSQPACDIGKKARQIDGTFYNGLFTGPEFFQFLNFQDEGEFLWIMVYTASTLCPLKLPVKRLLLAKGTFLAEEKRMLEGIHTKLYLLFDVSGSLWKAFLGSQNLVRPTYADLMLRAPRWANRELLNYFNFYWEQSESAAQ